MVVYGVCAAKVDQGIQQYMMLVKLLTGPMKIGNFAAPNPLLQWHHADH
jgi:hypothetical protein